VVEELRPRVVSFHFGLPAADLLSRVQAVGAKILASATTLEEALWLEDRGCDVIIAQGLEAGGHRGMFLSSDLSRQIGTFALVRQVVDAVRVPVVAAGGIGDGRGVAAALALGAAGVQIGTAYLLCPESTVSPVHRRELEAATADSTAVTNVQTGRPARGILNRLMREQGPMADDVPEFPFAASVLVSLRQAAESDSRSDFSPLWCGQYPPRRRGMPAAELTRQLAAEALEVMREMAL
jgi:nitronate monooxygenase